MTEETTQVNPVADEATEEETVAVAEEKELAAEDAAADADETEAPAVVAEKTEETEA